MNLHKLAQSGYHYMRAFSFQFHIEHSMKLLEIWSVS